MRFLPADLSLVHLKQCLCEQFLTHWFRSLTWLIDSLPKSSSPPITTPQGYLSIFDTFWPIFGHFSYSTSINHSLTIELNNILNWITRVYFELNNILNWILGKAILNRKLNESFFGKIQILNWIRFGIVNHYCVGDIVIVIVIFCTWNTLFCTQLLVSQR